MNVIVETTITPPVMRYNVVISEQNTNIVNIKFENMKNHNVLLESIIDAVITASCTRNGKLLKHSYVRTRALKNMASLRSQRQRERKRLSTHHDTLHLFS